LISISRMHDDWSVNCEYRGWTPDAPDGRGATFEDVWKFAFDDGGERASEATPGESADSKPEGDKAGRFTVSVSRHDDGRWSVWLARGTAGAHRYGDTFGQAWTGDEQ
jgi:hypothetical protein